MQNTNGEYSASWDQNGFELEVYANSPEELKKKIKGFVPVFLDMNAPEKEQKETNLLE